MSKWRHDICNACWEEKNKGFNPVRLKAEFRDMESCCYCGRKTMSGIVIRDDPRNTKFCNNGQTHDN